MGQKHQPGQGKPRFLLKNALTYGTFLGGLRRNAQAVLRFGYLCAPQRSGPEGSLCLVLSGVKAVFGGSFSADCKATKEIDFQ